MTLFDMEQVYRDYYPKIKSYVSSKVGDADNVEDIVSDVFMKVAEHRERYDSEKAALSTWIYTIANRTVVDYFRTRKVHQELPEDNGENGVLPDSMIDMAQPGEELLQEEQLAQLAAALKKLPKRERDLIILYYYQNLTLKVIAEKMRMSYPNAKIVHKKALEHLRKEMD